MEITLNTVMNFGKFKGELVSELLPSINNEIDAKGLKPIVKYFMWINRETNYILNPDVINRMKEILNLMPKPKYSDSTSSRGGRYEHYNDMGAMNGISFQDVYGDFGF